MNEHAAIRELLTLAAAGALDDADADQRRVEDHLLHCPDCRAELAAWQRLAGALEALPTPQAPLGLVERTRRQMERRAAAQAENRQKRVLLVWLTVFGWATTLMSWVGFLWMGGRLALVLGVSSATLTMAWIIYMLAVWLATALAAGLLGQRYREGRQYEPVF